MPRTSINAEMIDRVKSHEGFRTRAYKDTVGVLTVGYGTNLESREFSLEECEGWLMADLLSLEKQLEGVPAYCGLDGDGERQGVLIEMAYNLGFTGLMSFKLMWAAIGAYNFDQAAIEMVNSKWAEQVGQRAISLASIMIEG